MIYETTLTGIYQIPFVKPLISPGQFCVKCSLTSEGTGILRKSMLFLSTGKERNREMEVT